MSKFYKVNIIENIGKKINNTISLRLLNDIADIISNYICDEISQNKTVSISKFGTFYQASKKPRLVWSNFLQKKIMVRSRSQIYFSPHVIFSKLLKDKRKIIIEILKSEKDSLDKKSGLE